MWLSKPWTCNVTLYDFVCSFLVSVLDSYKRLCLQSYGHSHLLTLLNLEKSGLLTSQSSSSGGSNYQQLRKMLGLTSDNEDPTNTTDFSYVHNGYAPLSVRY